MSELIIFGDSVIKGVCCDEESGKYKMTDTRIFKKLTDAGYKISQYARIGRTVDYGITAIEKKADSISKKTKVILSYGGNDCNFDWQSVSDAPYEEHDPISLPEKFRENYRRCIEYCKNLGAQVFVTNLAPIDSTKYMETISRGRSKENILKWLGDVSVLYRWHEYYNEIVTQTAKECGAELIDIRTDFLTARNFKKLISSDGIHPTAKGHLLIQSAIENAIINS